MEFRARIDALDNDIIRAVATRLAICREVALFKKTEGLAMMQPDRVEAVKNRAAAAGVAVGLDRDFVVDLYSLIIGEACRLEDELMENHHHRSALRVR
jgi:chorismate mutase-like protein